MITLLREPQSFGEHVLELQAWVAGASAERYWHQPRSAYRRFKDGELVVTFWCGPFRRDVQEHDLSDEAPDEALRCGTCFGRREGFEHSGGLIFRPRDAWAIPSKCPGGDDGTGHCIGCGRRLRYYGTYYSRESDHAPEPELTKRWEPCPWHGWQHVRPRDGVYVCTAWRCPLAEEGRVPA